MAKRELLKATAELKITVKANQIKWEEAQAKAKTGIAANLKVDGFRKGKIPANLLNKYISQPEVWQKALPTMLDELVKEAAKEIKEEEIILDGPAYNVEKLTGTELEVSFIYPVYPEIKLSDYKNLKSKFVQPKLDEKAVDAELKNLQNMHSILVPVERKAKLGDTLKFDFEGFVGEATFQGGKAEDYELELGSGQFIPGFEEQLVGVKAGEEKEVKVTFPEEYHSEELKGKEAKFICVVKEVKVKETPELNDDFAKEINAPGVTTFAELKKYMKDVLTEQAIQKARMEFKEAAFTEIKAATKLVVPMALVTKEMKSQEQKFLDAMKQQGIDKKTYMEMTGIKEEALQSQYKEAAESSLKDSLVFAEIAKIEKIELTDADYDKEYEKLAKVYQQDLKNVKTMIQKVQMQIPMTNEKVIDILIENNK
ncbi:MAG: trigger factor [Mycoplasmatales bacterium]|nr:trigger factor [Mycoplasmatales bacterium]